ncbi:MAG: hypothetical protein ACJA2M_001452 [Polaribacter sp.]|jgi:hypothetical protein
MKNTILLFLIYLLTSCSPPTKKEAIDYYLNIKYEITSDILARLDYQQATLGEFLGNPSKLTKGPDAKSHKAIITEQKEIIPELKACIQKLEEIDELGDNADYLGNMIAYLNTRLSVEENTMLRIVELLENGMTPEESKFLHGKTDQLLNLQKQQKKLMESEENFLKEFKIDEADIKSNTESIEPIISKNYDRYIMAKNTSDEYLKSMIKEYAELNGTEGEFNLAEFGISKTGEWYVIKVPLEVDFYTYHNLVEWFNGYESNEEIPDYSIGFAKSKNNNSKNYLFYTDSNIEARDTQVGIFADNSAFSIYLPEAYEETGNLTIDKKISLTYNSIQVFLDENGFKFHYIDELNFSKFKIKLYE